MKNILKEFTKGIKINSAAIEEIKKYKETLTYVKSLNLDTMPDPVKEMHLSMIDNANKNLEKAKEDFIVYEDTYESEDLVGYADSFNRIAETVDLYKDLESLNSILGSEDITVTEGVKKEIGLLFDKKNSAFK